jgi:hypothetical protein
MTKQIWKFPLTRGLGTQLVIMPKRAGLLDLRMQERVPTLWALVDVEEEMVTNTFHTYGTGRDLPRDILIEQEYIGSYSDGIFELHVFKED